MRESIFDGYCNQCAELFEHPPGLAGVKRVAICSGCGMTSIDVDGNCTGHNHGVDLRRKREGAKIEEVCARCHEPAGRTPIRDMYGVPYCSAMCRLSVRGDA
jgi:hypothetical protein